MNRKFRTVSLAGIAVMLAAVGCKSTWSMKNPFSSKPEAHVASPAEMDELQLKAPPENYTRGEIPGRNRPQKESLAQNGAYQSESVPGFASADTRLDIQTNAQPNANLPIASQNIPINQTTAANGLAANGLAAQQPPFSSAPVQNAPIRTAMNPSADHSLPTGSYAAPAANPYESPLAPYTTQGVAGNTAGAQASDSNATPSSYGAIESYGYGTAPTSETPVFAPGSIGGY